MNVKRILATKGTEVITIKATESIKSATTLLAKHNIGALVVVDRNFGAGRNYICERHYSPGRQTR